MKRTIKIVVNWLNELFGVKEKKQKRLKRKKADKKYKRSWYTRQKMSRTHKELWASMPAEKKRARVEKMRLRKFLRDEVVGS